MKTTFLFFTLLIALINANGVCVFDIDGTILNKNPLRSFNTDRSKAAIAACK